MFFVFSAEDSIQILQIMVKLLFSVSNSILSKLFVYTFCEILIFVSKMAAGLIHFGLKISIDVADFQQQVIL